MLNLIHMLAGRPWAIRADIASHVHGLVQRDGFAGLRHLAEIKQKVHAFDDDGEAGSINDGRAVRVASGIGVVRVLGVLTQRGDVVNSAYTRSTDAIAREVTALAASARVDAIVLEIDSPGGEVYGVPEAYAAIAAAAKSKPVVAVSNAQEASAALYLGSAASEKFVTPSGEIGSLGVYAMHVDESKAVEAEGVTVEFVVADESPFKVEGNPYEPLSESAREQIKKSVNRYMAMFVRDVARGRGVSVEHVRQNFGKGRMLAPQEAVAAKMADRIGTLDDAMRRAAQLGREARKAREAAAPRADAPEGGIVVTGGEQWLHGAEEVLPLATGVDSDMIAAQRRAAAEVEMIEKVELTQEQRAALDELLR